MTHGCMRRRALSTVCPAATRDREPSGYRAACRQSGQALPLMLGVLLLCGVAWIGLMRVSLTANARVRLTHAADAVAYSAAVAQARSLNLLAYINRAQVAHQIAVAHWVTLASLTQFAETLADARAAGDPPEWLLQRHFGAEAMGGHLAALPMLPQDYQSAHERFADVIRQHDNAVHDVLYKASTEAVRGMRAMREATMLSVLRANYPELEENAIRWVEPDGREPNSAAQLTLSSVGPADVVLRHEGNEAGPFRQWVEDATPRYPLLQSRDATSLSTWDSRHGKTACGEKRFELRRRGLTRLDASGHWFAQDSLAYQELQSNSEAPCYYRENPLAWGQTRHQMATVPSGDRPPDRFAEVPFWRWARENTAWDIESGKDNFLSETYGDFDARLTTDRGLPAYHDISEMARDQPLQVSIQLRQTLRPSRLAATRGGVVDALLEGLSVTVTSAAQTVYIDPANRSAKAHSRADLFRPRWMARLAPQSAYPPGKS
jgi:hypothetical protein